MTTVSTKQLRENMPEVINLLKTGQPIRLTYRRRVIGTLQPERTGTPRRGSKEAVMGYLKTTNFGHVPADLKKSPKSFKEEIADLRGDK